MMPLSEGAIRKGYTVSEDEGTCYKVYNPDDASLIPYYVHKNTMKGVSWKCEEKAAFAPSRPRKGGNRITRKHRKRITRNRSNRSNSNSNFTPSNTSSNPINIVTSSSKGGSMHKKGHTTHRRNTRKHKTRKHNRRK